MKKSPINSDSQGLLPLGPEVQIDYQSAEYLREPVIAEIKEVLGGNGRITENQLTSSIKDEINWRMERRNLQADYRGRVIVITTGDDIDDPGEPWNGNN